MLEEFTSSDRNFSFCSNSVSVWVRWIRDSRKDLLHLRDWLRLVRRVGRDDSKVWCWDSIFWMVV
jgi:hypothetical protein